MPMLRCKVPHAAPHELIASCDRYDDLDDVRIGRTAGDGGGAVIELMLGREELGPPNEDEDDDDEEDDGFFGSEQQWLKKPIVREDLRLLRETNVEDLERVRIVVEQRGIAWESIKPMAITIRLDLNGQLELVSDIRARILRLADAVQRSKYLEHETRTRGDCRGTLFVIEGLEINVLRSHLHDQTLEGLLTVLQCGVPVEYLRLPPLGNDFPSLAMWATLLRLAFSVNTDDEGRIASARHIVVPAQYAGMFHFAGLCSALAIARGVDVIECVGTWCADGAEAFDPVDREYVLRWLAFALLSSASRSSVTRLMLDGE